MCVCAASTLQAELSPLPLVTFSYGSPLNLWWRGLDHSTLSPHVQLPPGFHVGKAVDWEAHRNSEGWMNWSCLRLIQQRREPPMATRRAPVTLPLWSKNLCRTAWRRGQAQWGWAK